MKSKINILGAEAMQHLNAGRLAESQQVVLKILRIDPDEINALQVYGYILSTQGLLHDAINTFEKIHRIQPRNENNLQNLGKALYDLGQYEKAIDAYKSLLSLNPQNWQVQMDIGSAYMAIKRYEDAIKSYDLAERLSPNNPLIACNRAGVYLAQKEFNKAHFEIGKSLATESNSPEAWTCAGNIYAAQFKYHEALRAFDKAVSINDRYAPAWTNKGNALLAIGEGDLADKAYIKSLEIEGKNSETLMNVGYAALARNDGYSAYCSFNEVLSINPNQENLFGVLAYAHMLVCDWSDWHLYEKNIQDALDIGLEGIHPFATLSLIDNPSLQKKVAEAWSKKKFHPRPEKNIKKPRNKKIKVGYFSGDFKNHPVSQLIVGLLDAHNKEKFHIILFSYGVPISDDYSKRLSLSADEFIDISKNSDEEVAGLTQELGLDIAVDLAGHTQNSRLAIFSSRLASVHVEYLGFPGTTGTDFIDYILADETIISDISRQHFSESVKNLQSYQPNDPKRIKPNLNFRKEDFGFPPNAFIYCSFNNSYKINPFIFDIWAQIINRSDHGYLWLSDANHKARENLTAQAKDRGIDANRIIFAKRMENHSDHLGRYVIADLFLDTFPYGAHTTASDALFSGLPVLTMPGQSFQSRVAASLLTSLDLKDLIVQSPEAYIDLAVKLSKDKILLGKFRELLNKNIVSTQFFDMNKYAINIESAYEQMLSEVGAI